MPHPRKWSPVIVTWEDAETEYKAQASEEMIRTYKPCIRKTIGFLLHRDKERIFVCMDNDKDRLDDAGSDCEVVTIIPYGMVHDVEYL